MATYCRRRYSPKETFRRFFFLLSDGNKIGGSIDGPKSFFSFLSHRTQRLETLSIFDPASFSDPGRVIERA